MNLLNQNQTAHSLEHHASGQTGCTHCCEQCASGMHICGKCVAPLTHDGHALYGHNNQFCN